LFKGITKVSGEPDIYVYKIVVDSGGAPCVSNNVLSLAICKPKIRKTAGKGSVVLGFGGKEYEERLIYVARVTRKLEGPAYYRQRKYARRPDCIYRAENGRPVRKHSARYHVKSDQRKKDVGRRFERAYVLLSKDFRYLGKRGTDDYKKRYPKITRLIDDLTQGHRRHHSATLRKELMALKAEIWRKYRRKKVGLPTETDRSRPCNQESPSIRC
jgi:hypothetical protein